MCENLGDHMVGNVYVKFEDEEDADDALKVSGQCARENGGRGGSTWNHDKRPQSQSHATGALRSLLRWPAACGRVLARDRLSRGALQAVR